VQSLASFDRIQEYCSYCDDPGSSCPEQGLNQKDTDEKADSKLSAPEKGSDVIQLRQSQMAVYFSGESCGFWNSLWQPTANCGHLLTVRLPEEIPCI
jgi:hypothetical protein